ncbi:MAG TPA: FHA domain-containing protein [Pyrinomonadaceae bacterium]|nr:FHA domain-containing protein [Pyrinomonadaceae bacterium]
MNFAKLIVLQPGRATRELEILDDRITIGRAADNTVALEGDTNVSRYHGEIEKRGDEFYLIDLGSSNGTTVNDEPIGVEQTLRNEDLICVGGSTLIEFHLSDYPWRVENDDYPQPVNAPPPVQSSFPPPQIESPVVRDSLPAPAIPAPANAGKSGGGISLLFIAVGVGGGLLLVAIVAVLVHSYVSSKCNPTVRIVNPPSGTTIREQITIRVEVEDQQCIDRLIYEIDGRKLQSAENPPYEVQLDPLKLQDVEPGNHNLSVTVEDKDGKKALQPGSVLIAFETTAAPIDTPSPGSAVEKSAAASATTDNVGAVSITEVRDLCIKLSKEFPSSKTEYKYDMEFLSQVQSRTSEYARQGFSDRARPFRDVINTNFIDGKNLDEPLGYILAMSRSGFVLQPGQSRPGGGQGLWQMSPAFAQSTGYSGLCGAETLADQSQRCAALVAATYAKALVTSLFEGDFIYGVACFSMSPKEAGEWRAQLPPDRGDFWKVIRRPEQRDRVVRFFAAGIVGENPEKFNLSGDRKLSNLYPKK